MNTPNDLRHPEPERRWSLLWLLILTGSVLLRMAYGTWLLPDLWPGDAVWYKQGADFLLQQGWADPYWPPGLSHLLAGATALLGDQAWIGMWVGLLLWLIFFMLLLRALMPYVQHWQGWGIMALFAIYPAFVHQSVVPLTYLPVAICLLVSWQYASGGWGSGDWKDGLVLGIMLGLMVLFRGASLALWPVVLWGYWQQREGLRVLILPLLTALLLVGSWEYRLYQQEDRWIFINSANSYNFYLGNNPWTPTYQTWLLGSHDLRENPELAGFYATVDSVRALPEGEQEQTFRRLAWQQIGAHPGEFVMRAVFRIATLFSYDSMAAGNLYGHRPGWSYLLLGLDALAFILLGLAAWWAWGHPDWRWQERVLWVAMLAAYSLPYVLAFSHPTYHLPLLPLFALAAAKAPAWSWQRLRSRSLFSWVFLTWFAIVQGMWTLHLAGWLRF